METFGQNPYEACARHEVDEYQETSQEQAGNHSGLPLHPGNQRRRGRPPCLPWTCKQSCLSTHFCCPWCSSTRHERCLAITRKTNCRLPRRPGGLLAMTGCLSSRAGFHLSSRASFAWRSAFFPFPIKTNCGFPRPPLFSPVLFLRGYTDSDTLCSWKFLSYVFSQKLIVLELPLFCPFTLTMDFWNAYDLRKIIDSTPYLAIIYQCRTQERK